MGVLKNILTGLADTALREMERNARNYSYDRCFNEEKRAAFASKAAQCEAARASLRRYREED